MCGVPLFPTVFERISRMRSSLCSDGTDADEGEEEP